MSRKIQHNSNFPAKIFTDEASFNKYEHFWAGENQHALREANPQIQFWVNV